MTRQGDSLVVTVRVRHLLLGLAFLVVLGVGFGLGLRVNPGKISLGPLAHAAFGNGGGDNAPFLVSAFARVAESVEPSVVHITTVDRTDNDTVGQGTGSGFVVSNEGYILTNYHVVQDASRIKVKFQDGYEQLAQFVAADEATDIAVVKITPRFRQRPVTFGDSDALRVGDWVVAIGSPFGLDQTVTAGIISAKERITDRSRNLQQFLQTDAAINPGNSGGPLLNLAGEVVGINTQIATQDGRFNGIGFAIPSVIVRDVYRQLVTQGRVTRGYLGVYYDRVTPQFAKIYGIPNGQGALIRDVDPGPAETAGITSGDVIVEFNGQPIRSDRDLVRIVAATPVGIEVTARYYREGQLRAAKIVTEERAEESVRPASLPPKIRRRDDRPTATPPVEKPQARKLGLTVDALSLLRARQMGLNEYLKNDLEGALVIGVDPTGIAVESGLREGDLVIAVNRKTVRNEQEFNAALQGLKPNDDVVLVVQRILRGDRRIVTSYCSLSIP